MQSFQKLKSTGVPASFYQCDVVNQEHIESVFGEIAKKNSIDILVNNAGVAHVGNIKNTTSEDLDCLYNVNIKGVYNGMKEAIPYFKKLGKGVIVNMASIVSSVGISDRFAYSMTKGAVLTMTYSVAKDYVGEGIRCNSISPARVHTSGLLAMIVTGKYQDHLPLYRQKQIFARENIQIASSTIEG